MRHGLWKTAEYKTWSGIRRRCYEVSHHQYRIYGGRGIVICPEWKDNFPQFLADMGPRPTALHSIDRIDPDGHYGPTNCRWATAKEQQNNRRNNRTLMIGGKIVRVGELCDARQVKRKLVFERLNRGWPLEEALSREKMR